MKNWQVSPPLPLSFRAQFPELPEIVLQLLHNRGLMTQEKIDEFLNPDYSQDIHDPFLFRDMKKAVARIFQAIKKDELIVIHGDYDADGVCASVILYAALKELGAKHLDTFLPDRELEGYGLNKDTMELLASAGAKLIITCDCGISNQPEIERANELGMAVIITDHHTVPPELPPALAIIHPKVEGETYPDKGLSGGGVAFKLAQALLASLRPRRDIGGSNPEQSTNGIASVPRFGGVPRNDMESSSKWLLDLVAISSVADMVPLLGESRTLTKYGLIVLNKTRRLGLRKLIEAAGLTKNSKSKIQSSEFVIRNSQPSTLNPIPYTLNTHQIAFQLAPRLNAAGRMQHANTAYQLLTTDDPAKALELARELNANNQERQKITDRLISQAKEMIEKEKQEKSPIIFVLKENWPLGLIGLVASRLSDEYYRPVLVMTKKDGRIHGSGRSIDEINIIEKLEKLKGYFEKFGGHPQACGFTLKYDTDTRINADDADYADNILEKFKTDLTALVQEEIKDRELLPTIQIDAETDLDEVDWELYDLLRKFEPFGEANPEPAYLARGLTVAQTKAVGSEGQHLQLWVKHRGEKTHKMIGFCFGDESKVGANWCQILKPGDKIDAVFEVSVNEWNGQRELQLKIEDLKYNTDDADSYADDTDHADSEKSNDTLIYGDLTFRVNGILFAVHNKLGKFCNEQQIGDAIEEHLKKENIPYEREKVLPESFEGERFARNRIDFLIDDKIILEIKVRDFIGKEEYYQCLRYLEALDKKLCLLVNFRAKYLKIKRVLNPKAKI